MIPTDTIDEFVKRLREAGGTNVESLVLFGSAVTGDFRPGLSDVNLLCILRDSSFRSLQVLERSTDVFTIELLYMRQHHRVLFGTDVLTSLRIPMELHRVQVEYELREKLILLRQHVLVVSDNDSRLWDVILHSAPSFATLLRHALMALGDS